MKRIVVFALVLNAALLGVIAHQLVAIAGGGAVAAQNGDTNGDGGRDITDAVYLLSWLFQGGPGPVEIVCPVDQGDRVAELEAQLAAGNAENAALQGQLEAANARIAELEGQDNSDCPSGILSPFLVEDCPPELARSVAKDEDGPVNDEDCQVWADMLDDRSPIGVLRMAELARRVSEAPRFPPDIVAISQAAMEFGQFFDLGGPEAEQWFYWCEQQCPE